ETLRLGPGTANSLRGPAMTGETLARALDAGRTLGAAGEADAAAFGEMGIANTSAAALVAAKITGLPVAELAGRGTGLDDAGLARKVVVLEAAAARTGAQLPAEAALAEYGGFEIAVMAGGMLGAAEAGRVVLVDGFIAGAAALAARGIAPEAAGAFVFAHRSAEAGHDKMLEALGAEPLLDLDLRLGEGTGALLAWPLLRAAAAMLSDMASFESAGVSGPA
ncbi:MAG: nicotinate-nucleotide--dimethylbenzimidazole phosphoribosyltransferase, partial [Pseudomonadota bacterium]